MSRCQASLSIHFLVVGGGISGLCCAVALARVGHRVTVLEQASSLEETLTNAETRLSPLDVVGLREMGIHPHNAHSATTLAAQSFEDADLPPQFTFYSPEVASDTGAGHLMLPEKVLHRQLHGAAEALSVEFQYGERVTLVLAEKAAVRTASGGIVSADVVVGADGVDGIVRASVRTNGDGTGSPELRTEILGTAFDTMIPREDVRDAGLLDLVDTMSSTCFFGDGAFGVLMRMSSAPDGDFGLQLLTPPCPLDMSASKALAMHNITPQPGLALLINRLKNSRVMQRCERRPLQEAVHRDGPVLVVANALEPIFPTMSSTLSFATADAPVLAGLFSHLSRRSQIGTFLEAFHSIVAGRRRNLAAAQAKGFELMCSPLHVRSVERATVMRVIGIDVTALGLPYDEKIGDEVRTLIGWNPVEAAEEWWLEWGRMREMSESFGS